MGRKRKEESHLVLHNPTSNQGGFLPTDVNPQLQSQLQAYDRNHKNEIELLDELEIVALELLGLHQEEQTKPRNTNLPASHGLPPLWQIKPSDDGTTDHKEYASGTMPSSIAGPDDELEIVLTTPYSVGANRVAASSHGLPPLW